MTLKAGQTQLELALESFSDLINVFALFSGHRKKYSRRNCSRLKETFCLGESLQMNFERKTIINQLFLIKFF